MYKIITRLAICLAFLTLSFKANADFFKLNQYKWNENEGRWVAKWRVGGAFIPEIGEDAFSNGIPITIESNFNFFDNSFATELELNYKWTDHIAFSLNSSYHLYQGGSITFTGFANNVNTTTEGKIHALPVSFLAQYRLAAYGSIKPYIGAGVHYTFFINSFDGIEIENEKGLVFQAGFDWWLLQNWGLNFDIKQYLFNGSLDFNEITGGNVTAEAKANPIVVGLGFMFRF